MKRSNIWNPKGRVWFQHNEDFKKLKKDYPETMPVQKAGTKVKVHSFPEEMVSHNREARAQTRVMKRPTYVESKAGKFFVEEEDLE